MNSCQKGKRGERAWRDELRAAGYLKVRRGQQFSGGKESPDVICEDLPLAHWEVKCVERLNLEEAMTQARRDATNAKVPFVAHKRNNKGWLVTMDASTFFRLLRDGQDCLIVKSADALAAIDGAQETGLDNE